MHNSGFCDGALVAIIESDWDRFREALVQGGVANHRQAHFRRWVEKWLAIPSDQFGRSSAEEFAQALQREGTEDWQCRQAFQAVNLWQRVRSSPAPEQSASGTPDQPLTWPSILERMERNLRSKQYSPRSVKTYVEWARRLAAYCPAPPTDSVEASRAVQGFLDHLALVQNLSPASIALARNAVAWLVRKELGLEMTLESKGDAHHSRRLPTILAPVAVKSLLASCTEPWDLFFGLQYGCGLRLGELLDLRVQDLDLVRNTLTVRSGKGDKDRQVPLPKSLLPLLHDHLARRKDVWTADLSRGWAKVELPNATVRKQTNADTSWEWQHVFGAQRPLKHPESGELRRWRPMETVVRDALREAAQAAGIAGRIHPHLLRHCYATHMIESGATLAEVQELMGHARLETTMIYLHVRSPAASCQSPLDRLEQA